MGPKMTPFLAFLGIFCHFPALFASHSEGPDLDRIFPVLEKNEPTRQKSRKSEIFDEK